MIEEKLFTISDAARKAGIHRSTLQRWIARKLLKKQPGGEVKWRDVQRCLKRHRTGRPCGLSEEAKFKYLNEAQQLARPFIQGRKGLHQLKSTLAAITNYHVKAGREKWTCKILTEALINIGSQIKNRQSAVAYSRKQEEARKKEEIRQRGMTIEEIDKEKQAQFLKMIMAER